MHHLHLQEMERMKKMRSFAMPKLRCEDHLKQLLFKAWRPGGGEI